MSVFKISGMTLVLAMVLPGTVALAQPGSEQELQKQRAELADNTEGAGFGPQSPRDLNNAAGENKRVFSTAPAHTEMNLCNIHFHKNAEHRGGEYTTHAGFDSDPGVNAGYVYDGKLTQAQLEPTDGSICPSDHGGLKPGDTIETHYVFSTAQVEPGPTLGACLSDQTMNPQLRVEGQVYVLVNDSSTLDFRELARVNQVNGYHQPVNLPGHTGDRIAYAGSTTGPDYNTEASPLQVSWSMGTDVAYVDINSVGQWCENNTFDEKEAHGVRNLVVEPKLLSPIQK